MNHQKIIVGVVGIPVRKNSKGWEFFLTQRLAPGRKDFHQKWQCAGGGLEFGETPEQTLVREFKEELDVVPKILFPYPILLTTTWKSHKAIDDLDSGVHLLLPAYIVSIGDQTPKNTDPDHETGEMGWFTYSEILTLPVLQKTTEYIEKAKKIIEDYIS